MITKAKTKIIGLMGVILVALFMLVPSATALGIRPAKTTLVFAEMESKAWEGQLWVVNNDHHSFTARVSVEGEMGKYVVLKNNELAFREDEEALPLEFEINLPETVPPGESTANIVVAETLGGESGTVSSRVVLKHKIIIQGEYPDKYVEAKLNFHDQGKEIAFVSEVQNLGKKDIGILQTTFYVNDKKQEEHALETETVSLPSKETTFLKTTLGKDLFELGEFEVSAVTVYDDQKVEVIRNLIVGQPEVEITYFDPYFIAYKINQYSMDLLNKWNKDLKNVYVDVEVRKEGDGGNEANGGGKGTGDGSSIKVDEFRTRSVDIEGEMLKRIQDYFNAKDKGPGKYSFDMAVSFWGLVREDQRDFHFESELINEGEAKDLELAPPPVGMAAGEGSGGSSSSLTSTLFWVLLGILLGAAGFYILWRYTHREQYEGGKEAF